jgi:hypothetical protein
LGNSNALLDRTLLERLDREQLITLLLAAVERNHILEQKIMELTKKIAELEGRLN